ncbi:MAG: DUF5618 family protein [Nitrospirae bacterium]|nr:DUF5618 family protein [Nitrospirota bacterium]
MKKETPHRYLDNAKETLSKAGLEDNYYTDIKYVKSACGIAYLGVLKAIDDYLLRHGISQKELPRKVEEYTKALKKYNLHNGKLSGQFNALYHELHIAGYYHGDLRSIETVKASIKSAKDFIEKIKQ